MFFTPDHQVQKAPSAGEYVADPSKQSTNWFVPKDAANWRWEVSETSVAGEPTEGQFWSGFFPHHIQTNIPGEVFSATSTADKVRLPTSHPPALLNRPPADERWARRRHPQHAVAGSQQ